MSFIKSLLSRVMLAGLFVVLLLVAANPFLKLSIVRNAQSILGTRFSVDRLRSSYAENYFELHGCRAGHPFRPMQNLFEADVIRFDFDRDALKHGQFLAHRATVDGLQLGSRRSSSGFLDEHQPERYLSQLEEEFDQNGQEWLNRANRQLEQDAAIDFACLEHLSAVLEQLPETIRALDERSEAIADRVQTLNARLSDAGENPLRNLSDYVDVIAEAEDVSRTLDELRAETGRVEQQWLMDMDRLTELRQRDLDELPRRTEVMGLDAEQLSQYLLGPEVSSWVGEAIAWVHWGRYFLPTLEENSIGGAGRGESVCFRGMDPQAALIVEKMVLRGTIPPSSGTPDQGVNFVGRLVGLTSNPEVTGTATELVVQTTSDSPLLVQATLGQGANGDHEDRVLVNLPSHPRPQRTLGNDQQFAIGIEPSATHVWMQLNIDGETLSGRMILKEVPGRMSFVTRSRRYGGDLNSAIETALDDVDRIDLQVELGGTLDHPHWTLESNLGPQLALSLRGAVQAQLVERHQQRLETQLTSATPELEALQARLTSVKSVVRPGCR